MLALTLTIAALLPQNQGQRTLPAPDPNEGNFQKWMTYVQPAGHEEAYREIGWRNEFWPAVQEAKRLGRPILFWTMNGHPLGCT
ncbi:MAG: hypothetical protein AB8H80_05650 [Planctomycetota bacterium]